MTIQSNPSNIIMTMIFRQLGMLYILESEMSGLLNSDLASKLSFLA